MGKKIAIGIDLGGTNIRGVLVDEEGTIISQRKFKSLVNKGKDIAIERMIKLIAGLINLSENHHNELEGIGIGSPGPLSTREGMIYFAPNLPGWENVPLRKIIQNRFRMKVILENDANAAGWGEKCFGAGRDVDNLACFTLGTGIGGGIIINGKIYHGNNDVSGEFGHMTVNKDGPLCNCGNYGCLEAYSSATGIRNRLKDRIRKGIKGDFLIDDVTNIDRNLNLKPIFESARKGDILTEPIITEAIIYLGIAISNIANLFNPEMIILMGGITNEGINLMNPLKKEVKKRTLNSNYRFLKIVFGELGDFAGALGAAALCLSNHDK